MTYLDVTAFGAIGDGIADDTAAIQAAAAAARAAWLAAGTDAGARGVTIFFPSGQYKMSGALHFDNTAGIRLLGEASTGAIGSAQSATLLFTQAADQDTDLISALASSNFQIEHIDIQYDNPAMLGTLVAVDGTYSSTDPTAHPHINHLPSSGTIAVTQGSTAITLVQVDEGFPWTPTAPVMRLLYIDLAATLRPYLVTITSATTGVLDTPYQGATDPAAPFMMPPGHDSGDAVFRNVHFGGPVNPAGHAAALLSLNQCIGAVVDKCLFDHADNGIVGVRYGGWGSQPATITDSTFMRLATGAGIRNPGTNYVVRSCTFEPAYGYDDGPVGILCSDPDVDGLNGGWSEILTIDNCWFGDGGGQDLRPWIYFNGTVLNLSHSRLSDAGPNQPLIKVNGAGGTVWNVNITGNYLWPHNDAEHPEASAPAIQTGVATISAMTIIGNRLAAEGQLLIDPDSRIQHLTIIDTDQRTDFRTGFFEYGRTTKSGVAGPNAFSAADFTGAPPGAWTVTTAVGTDPVQYAVSGKVMTIWFDIVTSTVTGTPDYLQIALPAPYLPATAAFTGPIQYREDNGDWATGFSSTVPGGGLRLFKVDNASWATTDPNGQTSVRGIATIPISWPNAPPDT